MIPLGQSAPTTSRLCSVPAAAAAAVFASLQFHSAITATRKDAIIVWLRLSLNLLRRGPEERVHKETVIASSPVRERKKMPHLGRGIGSGGRGREGRDFGMLAPAPRHVLRV